MIYEHYLNQTKPLVEWRLNEKLSESPEIVKLLENNSHPLFRRYRHFIDSDDEEDEEN